MAAAVADRPGSRGRGTTGTAAVGRPVPGRGHADHGPDGSCHHGGRLRRACRHRPGPRPAYAHVPPGRGAGRPLVRVRERHHRITAAQRRLPRPSRRRHRGRAAARPAALARSGRGVPLPGAASGRRGPGDRRALRHPCGHHHRRRAHLPGRAPGLRPRPRGARVLRRQRSDHRIRGPWRRDVPGLRGLRRGLRPRYPPVGHRRPDPAPHRRTGGDRRPCRRGRTGPAHHTAGDPGGDRRSPGPDQSRRGRDPGRCGRAGGHDPRRRRADVGHHTAPGRIPAHRGRIAAPAVGVRGHRAGGRPHHSGRRRPASPRPARRGPPRPPPGSADAG